MSLSQLLARRGSLAMALPAFCSGALPRTFASQAAPQNPPFNKILVANRGEIACRVMRTAKKMGIQTVAIFSEADRFAHHVRMADEAYCVGPPPSRQSYLNIPAVVEAVRQSGAQAVHPGYGFLSENHHFRHALDEAGAVFIGPNEHAIDVMGRKIDSKKLAQEAGVHIIPGYLGPVDSNEQVCRIANEIGYPVMIKASMGGGGKGMRVAYNDEEAVIGFRLSKQEASSSFDSDEIFIEKFIEEPRHVEIQVLADKFGNAIFLNERECSIQRRNQKVIEEAPSVVLTPEVRNAMGQQACMLAKAVNYHTAGTVEFLVDKHTNFYFLEMNTRLQVEHPITEMITGVDIVEQMIRTAAGQPLELQQSDVKIDGWALECRVYAEDPLKNYLPQIGTLRRYIEPTDDSGEGRIRCDSGVIEGSEISFHYDPMICKLVTHGRDRTEAIEFMKQALDSYVIRGLNHNINLMRSVIEHPRFVEGRITTKFLQEEYPDGYKGHTLTSVQKTQLLGTSAALHLLQRLSDNPNLMHEELLDSDKGSRLVVQITDMSGSVSHAVHVSNDDLDDREESSMQMRVDLRDYDTVSQEKRLKNAQLIRVNAINKGPLMCNAVIDDIPLVVQIIERIPYGFRLQHCGSKYDVRVFTQEHYELWKHMPGADAAEAARILRSPMVGVVRSVAVELGQEIEAGQEVAVMEAMKMQNLIRSEIKGKVKVINIKEGDTVHADDILIELE